MKAPLSLMLLPLFGLALSNGLSAEDTRPNILWITIEDWGPELSCYGTKGIHTPHVDKLASEGIRFQRYDFNRCGWPAWYPTRTLEEWEQARAAWGPYVSRSPTDKIPRPQIVHSKAKKK
jgi:hypothetical protein